MRGGEIVEEKFYLLRSFKNVWYYVKGEKIYFYDESLRKEEVCEVARVHPNAKEVANPPQKIVDVFQRNVK